jgi:hypothetical protein
MGYRLESPDKEKTPRPHKTGRKVARPPAVPPDFLQKQTLFRPLTGPAVAAYARRKQRFCGAAREGTSAPAGMTGLAADEPVSLTDGVWRVLSSGAALLDG